MERTVIEKLADDHIAVTRETPRGIPGSAHDRRKAKKREAKGEWRKLARRVFRHGTIEAYAEAGVTCLPGDPEIAAQARDNETTARKYANDATNLVAAIQRQAAKFGELHT